MVNHDAYLSAMKNAANAAWDGDWDRAIAEYRRALEAIPDDSQAMAGLALSLMETKRLDEALKVDPEEPTALLLSAGIANARENPKLALELLDRFDKLGERPSGLLPPDVTAEAIRGVAEEQLAANSTSTTGSTSPGEPPAGATATTTQTGG